MNPHPLHRGSSSSPQSQLDDPNAVTAAEASAPAENETTSPYPLTETPEMYDLLENLTSLSALSLETSAQLDEYELLVMTLHWIMQTTDAMHGAVYLHDEEAGMMTVAAVEGEGSPQKGIQEPTDQGLLGEMMRTQRMIYKKDYASYEGRSLHWPLNAAAIAPMIARHQLLGAIAIGSKPGKLFDGIALHLLTILAGQTAAVMDNRRLFRAEQQKARQLRLLNDITYAADSYHTVDDLLQYMAETLNGLFDADSCYISLWDEALQLPIPVAATQPLREQYLALPIPAGEKTFADSVMAAGKPIFVPDVLHSDLVNPAIVRQFPARSLMGLPLIIGQNRLGAVFLGFNQPTTLSQEDIRTSGQIANQIALVLTRTQLLDWERRQRQLTEVQLAFSQGILKTSSVTEAAKFLMDTIGDLVKFDSGSVMLFDTNRGLAFTAAAMGYTDIAAAQARPIPIEEFPLLQEMIHTLDPIYIPDVRQHSEWKQGQADDAREVRTALFLPLQHKQESLVGYLTLKSYSPEAFPPSDRDQIQLFCNLAAATLQNHRLLRQSRQRAEELITAYDDLQQVNQIRRDVVHNASHELRTPLTFIQGYAGMLNEGMLGDLTPEQQEAVKIILARSESMNKMIEEMVINQESDAAPLVRTDVDLAALVDSCTKAAKLTAADAGVTFAVTVVPDLPHVMADPQRIGQVIDNLLTNAIKFSPDGGTVSINLSTRGSMVAIRVADQGVGIPPDQLHLIWDRFYRVKNTAQTAKGTGLGLNIVRHIVEAHGGQIWAESPGKGSIFHVELPIRGDRG